SNAHIPIPPKSVRSPQHSRFAANTPMRSRPAGGSFSGVEPEIAMSEEEQRKLLALEMRLPRVAGKIDSLLLAVIAILLCIGLVMVYSASSFVAAHTFADASYFFQKQLLGSLLGLAAMFVTMRIDYRQWRRFSLWGMIIALPLLLIVLVYGT